MLISNDLHGKRGVNGRNLNLFYLTLFALDVVYNHASKTCPALDGLQKQINRPGRLPGFIKMNTEPRIYVGTYSKYNNGSIAGAWVDLDGLDKESFYEACQELHKDEEDPEFMFQDFEGFPREFYGESGLDAAIWDWLAMDDNDREMLAMYCEAIGCDGLTLEDAQEAFAGNADSEADFCENLAEETEAVPKDFPTWISIDWEATWKCSLQYDYTHATAEDGTLWFFRR